MKTTNFKEGFVAICLLEQSHSYQKRRVKNLITRVLLVSLQIAFATCCTSQPGDLSIYYTRQGYQLPDSSVFQKLPEGIVLEKYDIYTVREIGFTVRCSEVRGRVSCERIDTFYTILRHQSLMGNKEAPYLLSILARKLCHNPVSDTAVLKSLYSISLYSGDNAANEEFMNELQDDEEWLNYVNQAADSNIGAALYNRGYLYLTQERYGSNRFFRSCAIDSAKACRDFQRGWSQGDYRALYMMSRVCPVADSDSLCRMAIKQLLEEDCREDFISSQPCE